MPPQAAYTRGSVRLPKGWHLFLRFLWAVFTFGYTFPRRRVGESLMVCIVRHLFIFVARLFCIVGSILFLARLFAHGDRPLVTLQLQETSPGGSTVAPVISFYSLRSNGFNLTSVVKGNEEGSQVLSKSARQVPKVARDDDVIALFNYPTMNGRVDTMSAKSLDYYSVALSCPFNSDYPWFRVNILHPDDALKQPGQAALEANSNERYVTPGSLVDIQYIPVRVISVLPRDGSRPSLSLSAFLGVGPKYEYYRYETRITVSPSPLNTFVSPTTILLTMRPMSTFQIVEFIEYGAPSFVETMAMIGGLVSMMAAFLVFMFGARPLSPWGFLDRNIPWIQRMTGTEIALWFDGGNSINNNNNGGFNRGVRGVGSTHGPMTTNWTDLTTTRAELWEKVIQQRKAQAKQEQQRNDSSQKSQTNVDDDHDDDQDEQRQELQHLTGASAMHNADVQAAILRERIDELELILCEYYLDDGNRLFKKYFMETRQRLKKEQAKEDLVMPSLLETPKMAGVDSDQDRHRDKDQGQERGQGRGQDGRQSGGGRERGRDDRGNQGLTQNAYQLQGMGERNGGQDRGHDRSKSHDHTRNQNRSREGGPSVDYGGRYEEGIGLNNGRQAGNGSRDPGNNPKKSNHRSLPNLSRREEQDTEIQELQQCRAVAAKASVQDRSPYSNQHQNPYQLGPTSPPAFDNSSNPYAMRYDQHALQQQQQMQQQMQMTQQQQQQQLQLKQQQQQLQLQQQQQQQQRRQQQQQEAQRRQQRSQGNTVLNKRDYEEKGGMDYQPRTSQDRLLPTRPSQDRLVHSDRSKPARISPQPSAQAMAPTLGVNPLNPQPNLSSNAYQPSSIHKPLPLVRGVEGPSYTSKEPSPLSAHPNLYQQSSQSPLPPLPSSSQAQPSYKPKSHLRPHSEQSIQSSSEDPEVSERDRQLQGLLLQGEQTVNKITFPSNNATNPHQSGARPSQRDLSGQNPSTSVAPSALPYSARPSHDFAGRVPLAVNTISELPEKGLPSPLMDNSMTSPMSIGTFTLSPMTVTGEGPSHLFGGGRGDGFLTMGSIANLGGGGIGMSDSRSGSGSSGSSNNNSGSGGNVGSPTSPEPEPEQWWKANRVQHPRQMNRVPP